MSTVSYSACNYNGSLNSSFIRANEAVGIIEALIIIIPMESCVSSCQMVSSELFDIMELLYRNSDSYQ